MKQATAIGKVAPPFTRGTFVPVRVGEGWASAPDQAEVDNEQIDSGGVRFFVCLCMILVAYPILSKLYSLKFLI